jgi:hypothetical protein
MLRARKLRLVILPPSSRFESRSDLYNNMDLLEFMKLFVRISFSDGETHGPYLQLNSTEF